ncbi:MAG: GDP-mannose 4,6-dehydratase [Gemmatimonadaceae bacterium]
MAKTALITGVTGQDGAYLARLLLEKGYKVFGGTRRTSSASSWRLEHLGIRNDVEQVLLDLAEFSNILRAVEKIQPDEVYNLAAQSFVGASFEQPIYTADVTGTSVVRMLEALRLAAPTARFYQASTSEMFGKVQEIPQRETTPFYPRSPYGVAKLYGHWITVNYREAYGMHASTGILFNHESPLRGLDFVTRKITSGLAEIRAGRRDTLVLGNLDAKRDWGYALDYVEGMWSMLQQERADDYVLSTSETTTVRRFVSWAAEAMDLDIEWVGAQATERAVDRGSGRVLVRVDEKYLRPSEVEILVGDSSKAKATFGWTARMTGKELARLMALEDWRRARAGVILY